ncbi:DNA mismatch repair protein MutS [Robertkochia marina]|uniref:DNA mismatch repair protein MutS n=1 Tax=Robertkochia marina TaxID=1227945 RepID=A0A4S3M4G8_9FLAO|nr:DNA mismatch repair protein MutS [Robertkochia marina]THD69077.1 DNA mismatch repair protein MutS [Robertkochia marina]TRZ44902.1 DNA mismatch repair protein MutS [Robertkochia marina]
MPQPNIYYREQLKLFLEKHKAVKAQLTRISVLRLLVFLCVTLLLYYYHDSLGEVAVISVPGTTLFLLLVTYTARLKYQRNKFRELIRINQTELDVLKGDLNGLDTGDDFKDPTHAYSHDIDLFGEGSFFHYSNRTVTAMGRSYYANELTANQTEHIVHQQEAAAELSKLPDWRQEFMANAALIKTETSENDILHWIHNFSPALPHRLKWLPLAWTLSSIALLIMTITEVLPVHLFVYWFIAGLLLSGIFLAKVSKLSLFISKSQDTFKQYQKLLEAIEATEFKSEFLNEQKECAFSNGQNPSAHLKKLARMIDALDQRNNLLVAVLINPLGLADLYNGMRIEKWVLEHREDIPNWFRMIAFFDATITKANFHFNHPDYCFPEITDKKDAGVIQANALGHPLIPEEKLIRNNFSMEPREFMVVTGANMAGKSTFLRTTALFIVMSNCGLPVCADKAVYKPICLITSMRTADSLNEEASYFYAELKRLRFIVDELKEKEYFIILDEILKGTNSKDKAMGSRKFVERLAGSGSTGIIATHDLSLCEVAEEIKSVKNYFFDAYIENNALRFDYILRPGICTNMNASFLLDKMGIV